MLCACLRPRGRAWSSVLVGVYPPSAGVPKRGFSCGGGPVLERWGQIAFLLLVYIEYGVKSIKFGIQKRGGGERVGAHAS